LNKHFKKEGETRFFRSHCTVVDTLK